MMVSIEATGSLERKMKVQVPAERIDEEVDKRLREVGKTAKLKGFRPGKVPFKVIRRQYGGQVRQDVLQEVLQSSYSEAIQQEKLMPAGGPDIQEAQMDAGKDLEYTAVFEVYPEIELKGLEETKLTRLTADIEESDIDEMVENLRRQRAQWSEVDRAAKDGDKIKVDLEGKIDGETFENGKTEGYQFIVGAGQALKDLEQGFVGLKAAEESSIDVAFPEDYASSELAGKKAVFEVLVHTVEEQVLPEMDDAFFEAYGVEEGGLEALRREVRENMSREMEQKIRIHMKNQIFGHLLDSNPVELPEALVNQTIDNLRQDTMRRVGIEQPPDPEPFREQAERHVRISLLMNEIIRSQSIQLDQDKVQARLADLASSYQDPQGLISSYRANPQAMSTIENIVLEEQAVEWLEERAEITEEKMPFAQLMELQAA